ncbi:hypothetical protein ACFSW8_14240 [Rubritalea tangerina]|uniref:Uncharacterized protein n=1 Tax=Rubritalea tangerina TaxID=430798 RepID=A0ABW4ZDI4_9BACT
MDEFFNTAHCDLEEIHEHSDATYGSAHDILLKHLSKVGIASEDMEEADFILNRYDSESNPIGVVSEYPSIAVVAAILSAQKEFEVSYSVHIDCESCGIIVMPESHIITYSDDQDGDKELKSYGFTVLD